METQNKQKNANKMYERVIINKLKINHMQAELSQANQTRQKQIK